jgi:hypothetical protein
MLTHMLHIYGLPEAVQQVEEKLVVRTAFSKLSDGRKGEQAIHHGVKSEKLIAAQVLLPSVLEIARLLAMGADMLYSVASHSSVIRSFSTVPTGTRAAWLPRMISTTGAALMSGMISTRGATLVSRMVSATGPTLMSGVNGRTVCTATITVLAATVLASATVITIAAINGRVV